MKVPQTFHEHYGMPSFDDHDSLTHKINKMQNSWCRRCVKKISRKPKPQSLAFYRGIWVRLYTGLV